MDCNLHAKGSSMKKTSSVEPGTAASSQQPTVSNREQQQPASNHLMLLLFLLFLLLQLLLQLLLLTSLVVMRTFLQPLPPILCGVLSASSPFPIFGVFHRLLPLQLLLLLLLLHPHRRSKERKGTDGIDLLLCCWLVRTGWFVCAFTMAVVLVVLTSTVVLCLTARWCWLVHAFTETFCVNLCDSYSGQHCGTLPNGKVVLVSICCFTSGNLCGLIMLNDETKDFM